MAASMVQMTILNEWGIAAVICNINTDKVININSGASSYSFPVIERIQAVNSADTRLWHLRGMKTDKKTAEK